MGIEDIIKFVNRNITDLGPVISREYGIQWTDKSLQSVLEIIRTTLQSERTSIESFAKTEGIREDELRNSILTILREMFSQAQRQGRKEASAEDFTSALTSLQWHVWPFCKSGERSGSVTYLGD